MSPGEQNCKLLLTNGQKTTRNNFLSLGLMALGHWPFPRNTCVKEMGVWTQTATWEVSKWTMRMGLNMLTWKICIEDDSYDCYSILYCSVFSPIHYWWEYSMAQLLMTTQWPSLSNPRYLPKNEYCSQKKKNLQKYS